MLGDLIFLLDSLADMIPHYMLDRLVLAPALLFLNNHSGCDPAKVSLSGTGFGYGTPELGKGKAEHWKPLLSSYHCSRFTKFHHVSPRKGPTTFGCQCVTTLLQGHVSLLQKSQAPTNAIFKKGISLWKYVFVCGKRWILSSFPFSTKKPFDFAQVAELDLSWNQFNSDIFCCVGETLAKRKMATWRRGHRVGCRMV